VTFVYICALTIVSSLSRTAEVSQSKVLKQIRQVEQYSLL